MINDPPDAWKLVRTPGQIDAQTLFDAVRRLPEIEDFDYRSEMLVHDGLNALGDHWGESALQQRLEACPNRQLLEALRRKEFEKVGFWSLWRRIVKATTAEAIIALFRDAGSRL